MNRQTSFNSQHMPLFEPLFSTGSSALSPLFTAPIKIASRKTIESNPKLYDGLISEISLSGQAQQCLQLIAPILRELSEGQHDRWLTLISPPKHITAQWLRDAGLNRERILVLHPRGLQSSQELACEALRLGCSHTIVSWFSPLPSAARTRLMAAADAGSSHILNIRHTFPV